MANNKTPGCDSLSVEWYKIFWDLIMDPLYEVYVFAYENDQLHLSARRGLITLIPKKERDILFVKNWRPLTMLNIDYKILAKALASRLKICAPPHY